MADVSAIKHPEEVHPTNRDFLRSLIFSISMIFGCEIGDKTFIVAALLAFENSRLTVFAGSYSALFIMTLLGVLLGHAAPLLFPRKLTDILGGVLFVIFGIKMLMEAKEVMDSKESMSDEFQNVRNEIAANGPIDQLLEEGAAPSHYTGHRSRSGHTLMSQLKSKGRNVMATLFSPLFIKAFALTFVSEWGDRSQIATIAMAASDNVYGVFMGANVGHACCTALAVISGKYISTKIKVHKVMFIGGILFIAFGLVYFYQGFF